MQKYNKNILEHVNRSYNRKNAYPADPNGFGSTFAKRIILIVSIYVTLINSIIVVFGSITINQALERQTKMINFYTTVGIFTGILIIANVLILFSKYLLAAIGDALGIVSSVMLAITFFVNYKDENTTVSLGKYLACNAIPYLIVFIIFVVMLIITVRYMIVQRKAYNLLTESLYKQYSSRFDNLTDNEWEEFMNTYEPQIPEKLKRSKKAKLRKEGISDK